jgi:hypothetical protein
MAALRQLTCHIPRPACVFICFKIARLEHALQTCLPQRECPFCTMLVTYLFDLSLLCICKTFSSSLLPILCMLLLCKTFSSPQGLSSNLLTCPSSARPFPSPQGLSPIIFWPVPHLQDPFPSPQGLSLILLTNPSSARPFPSQQGLSPILLTCPSSARPFPSSQDLSPNLSWPVPPLQNLFLLHKTCHLISPDLSLLCKTFSFFTRLVT